MICGRGGRIFVDVIGKGGANIRGIQADTNTQIDLSDDGTVSIAAASEADAKAAIRKIRELTADVEVGCDYTGTVVRITDFGAFVNILPGRDGLVHVSQIADERVANVSDYLRVGDVVRVRVLILMRAMVASVCRSVLACKIKRMPSKRPKLLKRSQRLRPKLKLRLQPLSQPQLTKAHTPTAHVAVTNSPISL